MKLLLLFNLLLSTGFVKAAQPVFSNVCTPPCTVNEGTTTLTQVGLFNVVDAVDGHAIQLCTSSLPTMFDIQQDGGDLSLFRVMVLPNAGLDYNVAQDYTIVATCTDSAGESETENILIDVIPDQPPTITAQNGGPYSVSENDNVQTELEAFTVNDPEGDTFSCNITDITPAAANTFGMWTDPTDYKLFLMSNPTLDAGLSPYAVTITCSDPFGFSTTTVSVDVVQNLAPVFSGSFATTKNANNMDAGDDVYAPTVADPDNGPEALSFSMTQSPASSVVLFSINPATGAITAATDLNYATEDTYALTVNASDGHDWTTQQITVNLNNANHAPIITNLPDQVFIPEDAAANTVLETLTTSDTDNGDPETITWSVRDNAGKDHTYKFNYNGGTRQFRLANGESFDYETVSSYIVDFWIEDDWAKTGPYTLTINITNENERCEFSADTYHASMYENNTVGVDPNIIVADDGTYTLDLDVTAYSSYFSLVSGNNITFAVEYDRDVAHPSNVTLWVVCTDDAALTHTATLSMTILDVNDNIPEFAQTGYIVNVNQFHEAGDYITTMAAYDLDSGENADIEYFWTPKNVASGPGATIYTITQHGRIRINRDANTMVEGEDYIFILTAIDQGNPRLSSTTEVTMVYREITTTTTTKSPGYWPDGWWDDEANLTVFIIGCILAAVALGLLAYMLWKYCGRFNCKTKNCCKPKAKPRVVKPKPAPERQKFDFWNRNPNSNKLQADQAGQTQTNQLPEIANQRAAPPKLMHPPTNMSTWMP